MAEIVVAGTIDFATAADRDGAVAATVDLQRLTRETEPGCLAYCFAADPVVPTRVQVYERWEGEAALAAHFDHPNYLATRTALRSFERAGASETMKYRIEVSAPVYVDGIATAEFPDV